MTDQRKTLEDLVCDLRNAWPDTVRGGICYEHGYNEALAMFKAWLMDCIHDALLDVYGGESRESEELIERGAERMRDELFVAMGLEENTDG